MAMNAYDMYDVPPEIAAEQERIARQQAIADAMLKSSMTPLATNQGPIHWTQVLAQGVNARQGRVDSDSAAAARRSLGQQYQTGLADEVKRIATMRQGQTIAPDPQEIEQANDQGYAEPRPVSTGNPKAAIEAALLSQYPQVRQMGTLEHKTFENEQTRANDRDERTYQTVLRLEADAKNQALTLAERQRAASSAEAVRKEIAARDDQTRRDNNERDNETRRQIAANRASVTVAAPVTVTDVIDPQNPGRMLRVDARTYKGGTLGAAGVLGVSGKEGDAQKREEKRAFNMQGLGATIQRAEDLLNGVVRDGDGKVVEGAKGTLPTQSGAGALVDAAAGFVGMSPDGAKEAQALEAVGGALTSKMPRMEGPQSDRDTALYKQMAAEIGNKSIPIERRKFALAEVKRLWAKYERLNPDAFSAQGGGGGAWEVVR